MALADFLDRLGEELSRAVRTPIEVVPGDHTREVHRRRLRVLSSRLSARRGRVAVCALTCLVVTVAIVVRLTSSFSSPPATHSRSAAAGSLPFAASAGAAGAAKADHRSQASRSSAERVATGRAGQRRAAEAHARRVLSELRLPPRARRVAVDDSRLSMLGAPEESPPTHQLVDLHSFWLLPGAPQRVIAWIEAHPPAGATLAVKNGVSADHGQPTRWNARYDFPVEHGRFLDSWLSIEAAAARRHSGEATALRADAQVVWAQPRPSTERIPTGVKVVHVVVQDPRRHVFAARTTASPPTIKEIIDLVEGLEGAGVHEGVRSCPAYEGPVMSITFSAARPGAVLARLRASEHGCGTVVLRVKGRKQPPLVGAERAIDRVDALLGMRP